jgi:hypothetical protein
MVRGTILVLEGGSSRSLEVTLDYIEETEDYSAVGISVSGGVLHTGGLETGASFDFELPLPPGALPSCKSEHGKLYWRLDVKSDERGHDTHERRRIEVQPLGRVAE